MEYFADSVTHRCYYDVPSVLSVGGIPKIFRVMRGQQAIIDDRAGLLFVILRDRRMIRLPGAVLSDTVRLAASGRKLSEVVGHPLLAAGTPSGDTIITHIRAESRLIDSRHNDVLGRWETIRLRSPLPPIADRDPPNAPDYDDDNVPF